MPRTIPVECLAGDDDGINVLAAIPVECALEHLRAEIPPSLRMAYVYVGHRGKDKLRGNAHKHSRRGGKHTPRSEHGHAFEERTP